MIKFFAVIAAIVALSGCASTGKVDAPVSNTMDQFTDSQHLDATMKPADLPPVPQARIVQVNGETLYAYDAEGAKGLLAIKNAAYTNYQLANNLINVANLQVDERNSILHLAKLEQERGNFLAQQWAFTKQALNQEQTRYTVMDFSYKALLGIGMLAVGIGVGGL